MVWEVNGEWMRDEKYDWDGLKRVREKGYVDLEKIYD